MGFIAPVNAGRLGDPQLPPNAGLFDRLLAVLNAPGNEALLGGPMALGKVLFHGTSREAAHSIMREGFDLSRFGQGADRNELFKGFLGKGVYGTDAPHKAAFYSALVAPMDGSVLRFHVPDEHILDLSTQGRLLPATHPDTVKDMAPVTKAINRRARKIGKSAVAYPGGETVIHDLNAINDIQPYGGSR